MVGGMRYRFVMNPMVRKTILCKLITFAYAHLLGNKTKLGLDSKVVLKVGGISPLGAILRGKGEKIPKGVIGGQNYTKGRKCSTTNRLLS